ncbi:MAG: hypothetical protein M3464_12020 [Chloroflexota bacterium]|nr:hypothetical protein [Chloroflexota bacterium]
MGAKSVGDDLSLGPRPAEVKIPVRKEAGSRLQAANQGTPARTTLTLEGVAGGGVEGVIYEVHVGATGARSSPRDRSFVGAIGLFGLQPWDHPGHGQHTANMSFDVTKAIAAADDDTAITVTPVPATYSGSARLPGGTWATIERMVLTVAGAADGGVEQQASPARQPKRKDKLAKRPRPEGNEKPKTTPLVSNRPRPWQRGTLTATDFG